MSNNSRSDKFIADLEKLKSKEERGTLAALRRGLGEPPGSCPAMYPFVFPRTGGLKSYEEKPYFIIASLFALHPDKGGIDTLGAVFRKIKDDKNSDSMEKRFVALLNADREDLPVHLRQAVSLAKSKDIPINWLQLLEDIQRWNADSRCIQKKWAREFWAYQKEELTE